MRHLFTLTVFSLLLIFLASEVNAGTITSTIIMSPSSDSSFTQGTIFTLTASTTCSGSGPKCNGVQLAADLPEGLSTSTNLQGCGNLDISQSCTKSWSVSANLAGTYSITVTGSSSNAGSSTSSPITVIVTAPPVPIPVPAPSVVPAPVPAPPTVPTPPSQVSITITSPKENQTFKTGDQVIVNAIPTPSAELIAEIGDSTVRLYDSGQHNDGALNDGVYGNNLTVQFIKKDIYQIKVRVKEEGKVGESFVNILVDPSLKIFSEFKKEYFKGKEIILSGKVTDTSNNVVPNTTVKLSLSYLDFVKNIIAETDDKGNFSASYYISFIDPDGNWSLKTEVKDKFGNSGSSTITIPVKTPPEAAYYYVKFNSPVTGFTYTRGDKIPISVEVSEGDVDVSNVNLSLRTVSGEVLPLKEIATGVYAGEYTLGFDDPYGNYTIEVFGYKTENNILKGGANGLALNVVPAKLRIELLSPQKQSFSIGQTVDVSVRVFYPDGAFGRDLSVEASTPLNDMIYLTETEPGMYKTTYKLKQGEEGTWAMQLAAKDQYANSGLTRQVVQVNPITFLYLLLTYWYYVLAGATPFAFLGYRVSRRHILLFQVKRYTEELKRIDAMKRDAQIKYFKESSINAETYRKLLSEYEKNKQETSSKLEKSRSQLETSHIFIDVNKFKLWVKRLVSQKSKKDTKSSSKGKRKNVRRRKKR